MAPNPNWKNRIVRTGTADPSTLLPNPQNYREHGQIQRESMDDVLSDLGWLQGVVVNERTNTLIDGHMRAEEAIKKGEKEIPVVYVDLTPEEESKALATFNPIGYMANENKKKLTKLIEALGDNRSEVIKSLAARNKIKLEDSDDVKSKDKIMDEKSSDDENETESDENIEKFGEIKPGDLFFIINKNARRVHRLVCGDCSDPNVLDAVILDDLPSVVVTSPPYNQELDSYTPTGMQKESTGFIDRASNAYKDSKPEPEYQEEQIRVIDQIAKKLVKVGSIFYNHKIRYREKEIISPYEWLSKLKNAKIRQEIIWNRFSSITLNARMFIPADERIYWLRVGDQFLFNDEQEIKSWTSIWSIAAKNESGKTLGFPVELPTRCILAVTKMGDIVFDPYSGSGTTILAAEKNGRIGLGIEISPKHLANSLRRFEMYGLEIEKA